MRNTRKRIITILLTLVMTITALLGNGIEARAAEYSLKYEDVMGYEFESGDVIIPDDGNRSWSSFVSGIKEPELIQYLKERNLYVNEPIAAEGEI